MRIQIETVDGHKTEGTLALKDETFVMVKLRRNTIRAIHWEWVVDVKRVFKGELQSVNLDIFKKVRE